MGTPDPYRVRIVSDLHIGSRWGLWPPDFEADGETYKQNRFNSYLWKCWTDIRNYPEADLLIVNGDVVDGDAPKDKGAGVKTTESDVQQLAAIETLRPIVDHAKKWYLIRGTSYHERWFAAIANELKAEKWPTGDRSGQVLDLVIKHLALNIAHHPEGGAVLYRGTMLDKLGLWSIIAAAVGKVPSSNVVIRSHHHNFGLMQSNGRTVIQTACYQLQTPYSIKKSYFRFQPDIGFVDILISKDEPLPIVVPVLYPLITKEAIRVG